MAQYPQGIFQSLQWLMKQFKILALQKQPTYTSISTDSAPYFIPGRGIYEITTSSGTNAVVFPDPTFCNGQTITIINTNGVTNQLVSVTNQPLQYGNTDPLGVIPTSSYIILVSINGVWRGITLS